MAAHEVDWDRLNATVTDALERYGARSTDRFLNQLLDVAVWQWTERNGKYSTGFITRGALAQREANRTSAPRRWVHQDLQHEHIITKAFLKEEMRRAGTALPLQNAVACIVTKSEHKLLNSNAHGWQRYVDAGLLDVVTDDEHHTPVDVRALAASCMIVVDVG